MPTQFPIAGTGMVTGFGLTEASLAAVFAGEVNDRPLRLHGIADSARQTGGGLSPEMADQLSALAPDEDPALAMIIAAAAEARGLAPATQLPADPELALILATNFGFQETLEWCWQERLDVDELDSDIFAGWRDSVAVAADRVGAGARHCQLTLSCASGTGAIALACDWLRCGLAKRVLVVCYDALTTTCWTGLSNLRTITDDCVRPFDQRRRGTVFGEGAAAILLDPQAETDLAVAGAATNNNAFHMTAPAKRADGSRRVLASAIADAGITANAIDFVSAHATGTLANDKTETEALQDLFGDDVPPTLALKSSLGHLLGAAGMAEVVVACAALRRGQLPVIQNSDEPDPACTTAAVRTPQSGDYRTAIVNSAGIGGSNGAAIIAKSQNGASLATVPVPTLGIVRAGWVLPDAVGNGPDLSSLSTAMTADPEDKLLSFKASPYLQSVKGYLDPTGAAALAAAAQCLRGDDGELPAGIADFALVSGTRFGPLSSGLTFYQHIQQRGPALASPMIFPHLYTSTPGNLAAIEFGIAGPHLLFDHVDDLGILFDTAAALIGNGRASNVLLLVFEHQCRASLPDEQSVGAGAVALWLTANGAAPLPPPVPTPEGTVAAILG